MKRSKISACVAPALGLGLALALVGLLNRPCAGLSAARAVDEITVCPDGTCDYTTIQAAVDAAGEGDVIKVATGLYAGVNVRPRNDVVSTGVVTQVVYVNKSVTIRGGYTKAFADPPDPMANPTTVNPQGRGRGLYITGNVSPTIEGLQITDGDAAGLGGYHPSFDWDVGGGVYVLSATVTISNCQVFSNTVDAPGYSIGYGGGLYLAYSAATLSGNTVTSNTTSNWNGQGGGLYLNNSAATLNSNTVSDNATGSNGDGGGLYLASSAATLNGNIVANNSASRSGGGLVLDISAAALTSNTIVGNIAGVQGGGLSVDSRATLQANTIVSNTADKGGGLYLRGSDSILNGNTVMSNTASGTSWPWGGGGGLYLDGAIATLNGNSVAGNISAFRGGGVYVYNSDGVTVTGNAISANTAITGGGLGILGSENAALDGNTLTDNTADAGGGLYIELSEATLTNNAVADNRADLEGSGLYIRRCSSTLNDSVSLLHTTIARNNGGDGSGVHIAYSTIGPYYSVVELVNTILVSQTVGITVAGGSTATLQATLWYGNGTNHGGAGAVISSTHVTSDPAFMDADAGDYHIREGSAARDSGVNVFVTTDIDGQLRPQGGGYDIGADEFHPLPGLTVAKRASPNLVPTGGQFTCTISVTNTGNVDLHAIVTDVLPNHVTPTGALTWTVDIPTPGGVWTETVVVTIEMGYLGVLTNAVQVTTEEGVGGGDSVTVSTIQYAIYLPSVLRQYP